MDAIGKATWQGDWHSGAGTMSTTSPSLQGLPYTFATRFEDQAGASPEELLASAHAGCFNQALANNLGQAGLAAASMETSVMVNYGIDDGLPTIRSAKITVRASVTGATPSEFAEWADRSAKGCTISRALAIPISLDAALA